MRLLVVRVLLHLNRRRDTHGRGRVHDRYGCWGCDELGDGQGFWVGRGEDVCVGGGGEGGRGRGGAVDGCVCWLRWLVDGVELTSYRARFRANRATGDILGLGRVERIHTGAWMR